MASRLTSGVIDIAHTSGEYAAAFAAIKQDIISKLLLNFGRVTASTIVITGIFHAAFCITHTTTTTTNTVTTTTTTTTIRPLRAFSGRWGGLIRPILIRPLRAS